MNVKQKYFVCTQFPGEIEQTQTPNESDETKNEGDEKDKRVINGASASPHLGVGMKGDSVASAVALHSFERQDLDGLSFTEGETLDIMEFTKEDWWLARNNNGEKGPVPSILLKLLSEGKCLCRVK